jgi:aminoglycoside 2''-phosphotransferase
MLETTGTLLNRIQTIMPDLEIEHFERNQEGTLNDVLIVNDKLVFRFAKTEKYARILQEEIKILELIRPLLELQVPHPILMGADYMVYPILPGQPLLNKMINALDDEAKNRIAEQLGRFLYTLHTLDVSKIGQVMPASRAPATRQDCLSLREEVRDKIFPLLQKDQIEWAEDLFNNVLEDPIAFEHQPVFVHGDLASYHILFDDREGKIAGIFDFGMAGMGDPANDIGNLISFYGETFVTKMGKTYLNLQSHLPRARYYAQAMELEWILRGLESGETFWFTAHLARARDILS